MVLVETAAIVLSWQLSPEPATEQPAPHARAAATELSFPERQSSCPEIFGRCLGARFADVDGDGRRDVVGLTFSSADSTPDALGTLVAHVLLADGTVRREALYPYSSHSDVLSQVGWIGLSDVNGDGRAELFVAHSDLGLDKGDYVAHVYAFTRTSARPDEPVPHSVVIERTERDPLWEPLRNMTRMTLSKRSGFICGTGESGRPQVIEWGIGRSGGIDPQYYKFEIFWEAGPDGVFHYAKELTDKSPTKPQKASHPSGARCAGLSPFPQR
ncbi:FG-GAP repeat domain-containing protein [Nonomuraea sp. NPDC049714]|uniref:FG-GAP repeat domain-containing protein n=1 Tax=Nonomuraea sp. NPDC049714 TaxID=3364357 RepID=UPI0037B8EE81